MEIDLSKLKEQLENKEIKNAILQLVKEYKEDAENNLKNFKEQLKEEKSNEDLKETINCYSDFIYHLGSWMSYSAVDVEYDMDLIDNSITYANDTDTDWDLFRALYEIYGSETLDELINALTR